MKASRQLFILVTSLHTDQISIIVDNAFVVRFVFTNQFISNFRPLDSGRREQELLLGQKNSVEYSFNSE